MNKEEIREYTYNNLQNELNNLAANYMKVYDEYYETGSRDSAFIKDLADAIIGISAIFEVYTRDKCIDTGYALEKLKFSKSYIDFANIYFSNKKEREQI